jgi:hypothetical protein
MQSHLKLTRKISYKSVTPTSFGFLERCLRCNSITCCRLKQWNNRPVSQCSLQVMQNNGIFLSLTCTRLSPSISFIITLSLDRSSISRLTGPLVVLYSEMVVLYSGKLQSCLA